MEWNCGLHPRFGVYVGGLLAYDHTPDQICNDPLLAQEFPPRRLDGLCDG